MVGCQPGAERPTDRERKRTGEKSEWASDRSFMWFGSVSLRIEGLLEMLAEIFLVYFWEIKWRRKG